MMLEIALQNNSTLLKSNVISNIILDYDGVIARKNTQMLLNISYEVISKYRQFDYVVFSEIFSSLVPFPLDKSIEFLLNSLGLIEIKNELILALLAVEHDIDDAKPFIDYCISNNVNLFLLSSGGFKESNKYDYLVDKIGSDNILSSSKLSKINPETYKVISEKFSIAPLSTLYIDDCPIALSSAKTFKYNTALMNGSVFSSDYLKNKHRYIDISVDKLVDIIYLLKIDLSLTE